MMAHTIAHFRTWRFLWLISRPDFLANSVVKWLPLFRQCKLKLINLNGVKFLKIILVTNYLCKAFIYKYTFYLAQKSFQGFNDIFWFPDMNKIALLTGSGGECTYLPLIIRPIGRYLRKNYQFLVSHMQLFGNPAWWKIRSVGKGLKGEAK